MNSFKFKKARLYAALFVFMLIFYAGITLNKNSLIESNVNVAISANENPKQISIEKKYFIQSSLDPEVYEQNMTNNKYIQPIDSTRLNKLFRILKEKEAKLAPVLDSLDILSFENILLNVNNIQLAKYFSINNNQVEVTEYFVNSLLHKSNTNSFDARINIDKSAILKVILEKFKFVKII